MPQTKLVFVKLMLSLADDQRFIMQLNDSQKLDYLLLLLMAGLTHNEIPLNGSWIKARFGLSKSEQEVEQNIDKIRSVYKKIVVRNKQLKFKNFKQLHNYIYKEKENSIGILKDFYKHSPNKVNLFLIISNIISFFITTKGLREEDVDMRERNRYGHRIKEILIKAKGDDRLVKDAIKWVSQQGYNDYTLETVDKKWPEFMAHKKRRNYNV